jgi:hypothetical protein
LPAVNLSAFAFFDLKVCNVVVDLIIVVVSTLADKEGKDVCRQIFFGGEMNAEFAFL